MPVVARTREFDPEEALALMARTRVRNAFIPPTALRMLRTAPNPRRRYDALACAASAPPARRSAPRPTNGASEALGLTINEFYGQTECNLVLASCAAIGVSRRARSASRCPATRSRSSGADGSRCEPGELGQIAVKRPDPVMFLEYWGKPGRDRDKFIGDWMTTGDQGVVDDDGYVHFVGRDDDVITSAGYRIGPSEIEDCLIRHPAVALAAVVGKPDPLRTEIVKAFIVLKPGHAPSERSPPRSRTSCKTRLSAHEYPREVAFIDADADDHHRQGDPQIVAGANVNPRGPTPRAWLHRARPATGTPPRKARMDDITFRLVAHDRTCHGNSCKAQDQ